MGIWSKCPDGPINPRPDSLEAALDRRRQESPRLAVGPITASHIPELLRGGLSRRVCAASGVAYGPRCGFWKRARPRGTLHTGIEIDIPLDICGISSGRLY